MNGSPGMELDVSHQTRYDYAALVSMAHHLAHLQPLQDEHQGLLDFSFEVEPAASSMSTLQDVLGNGVRHFSLVSAHRHLQVRVRSRVRVVPRFALLDAQASPAWEGVAHGLRYVALAPFQPAVQFVQPSPYVPRLGALRAYACESFTPGRPLAAAAIHLMQRVHADFAYDSGSTAVDTPLADVWLRKRGVCQDFSHLMIGALRMLGLSARYVSGYLLTQAPEGGPAMVGADASHAWLQVWCPGTRGVPAQGQHAGWLDLDPTNNLVPAGAHVRLALGRDFGDVTPLRGVIRGSGEHTLHVAVSTRLVAPEGQTHDQLSEHKLLD